MSFVTNYQVQAELQVQADNPADAGAALDALLAAVQSIITAANEATPPSFGSPVALQVEKEDGQYVFQLT